MKNIYPESRPDSDRILRAIVRNDYDSVVLIDSTDGSIVDIYHFSSNLNHTRLLALLFLLQLRSALSHSPSNMAKIRNALTVPPMKWEHADIMCHHHKIHY